MKICWDNLAQVQLSRDGNFYYRASEKQLYYHESCGYCEEPFLGYKHNKYCSLSCKSLGMVKGKRYGKLTAIKYLYTDTEANYCKRIWLFRCDCGNYVEKCISSVTAGNSNSSCGCYYNTYLIGKKFNRLEVIGFIGKKYEKVSNNYWLCLCDCGNTTEVASSLLISGAVKSCGCLLKEVNRENPWFKPTEQSWMAQDLYPYDLAKENFVPIESIKLYTVGNLNGTLFKCTYCGQWFKPTRKEVTKRLAFIKGQRSCEGRLYCSSGCKKACPIYQQQLYPRGFKNSTSREVQVELRQMVLERDNWTCQYKGCEKTVEDTELHCHHIEPISQNPIESADVSNCVTLCKEHHKLVHSQEGCKYFQLRCLDK